MIRAYIPQAIPGLRKPYFLEALPSEGSRIFQTIPIKEFEGIITRVPEPRFADIVIAPHEYADLCRNRSRFGEYREVARSAGKRLLISAYQDDNSPIHIDGAIVLRICGYKSQLQRNEIISPGYVEDIGAMHGSTPLGKGGRPSVGFAGMAGFTDLPARVRYVIRNYLLRHGAKRQGVYFRRRSLALLGRDPRIELHAIVRNSFSGNRKTVEVSPEQARREYIDNMTKNLFTLAPRGDGNQSLRFFETLSCGRIPVLIDTDISLPLEDRIDYDAFMLRIPWQKLDELPERVWQFWDSHSEDEIRAMQLQARRVFEEYLYAPAFFRRIFTPEYLDSVPNV